jgi:hypothetical protein
MKLILPATGRSSRRIALAAAAYRLYEFAHERAFAHEAVVVGPLKAATALACAFQGFGRNGTLRAAFVFLGPADPEPDR